MNFKLAAPGVAIAIAALLAVLFRYEINVVGAGGAFKLDRWTGDTYLLVGDSERKVVRKAVGE